MLSLAMLWCERWQVGRVKKIKGRSAPEEEAGHDP